MKKLTMESGRSPAIKDAFVPRIFPPKILGLGHSISLCSILQQLLLLYQLILSLPGNHAAYYQAYCSCSPSFLRQRHLRTSRSVTAQIKCCHLTAADQNSKERSTPLEAENKRDTGNSDYKIPYYLAAKETAENKRDTASSDYKIPYYLAAKEGDEQKRDTGNSDYKIPYYLAETDEQKRDTDNSDYKIPYYLAATEGDEQKRDTASSDYKIPYYLAAKEDTEDSE